MVSSLETAAEKARELRFLELLREAGDSFCMVTFSTLGDRIALEGCVESYALKAKAGKLAIEAGFTAIENCLRVAPGVAPRPNA